MPLSALGVLFGMAGPLHGGEGAAPAFTQWGQPELAESGIFLDVPLQRPAHFGDRQFLTSEGSRRSRTAAFAIGTRGPVRSAEGVEALYNDNIWAENRSDIDNVRTSLIVLPENGRLLPVQAGINHQPGGERMWPERDRYASRLGYRSDGPEDRGVSERCLVGHQYAAADAECI